MERPDVLVLLVDCLRADRCYGTPGGSVIPHLQQLQHESVVFSQAVSVHTTTPQCVATILTGRYPPGHGVVSLRGNRLHPDVPTLPGVLRRHGYTTYASMAGPLDPALGLAASFSIYELRSASQDIGTDLETTLVDRVLSLPHPFFALLHLWGLHRPCRVPAVFDTPRMGRTNYDRVVSALDAFIGRILDVLPRKTIVILTGDHGESIAEDRFEALIKPLWNRLIRRPHRLRSTVTWWMRRLGGLAGTIRDRFSVPLGHGFHLYEYLIRIPLIIRAPGFPARRVDDLVSQIDVAPTVLDLCGVPPLSTKPAKMTTASDGVSLVPWMQGARTGPAHDAVYISTRGTTILPPDAWLDGLRTPRFKYVVAQADGMRWEELYDLEADPHERRNLLPRRRVEAERFRTLTAAYARGPVVTPLTEEEERIVEERLRDLGYL